MAAKIRVGIVGATVTPGGSGWGANAHVPALRALPDFELKAVCTAHEATAKASAAAFGAELAFHDFEEMIAHPDIDLVAVVVRVPGHHRLVTSALEAGKAVFCEWPLGASLAEAEDMANLARVRSVSTAVGLQARSDPTFMYARELVQQVSWLLSSSGEKDWHARQEAAGEHIRMDRVDGQRPSESMVTAWWRRGDGESWYAVALREGKETRQDIVEIGVIASTTRRVPGNLASGAEALHRALRQESLRKRGRQAVR